MIYASDQRSVAPNIEYANLWSGQTEVTASPTPPADVSPLGTRTLRHRPGALMQGEDVKALQRTLNALGYDTGAVDGIFGRQTEAAVRAYQRATNLETTGVVDKSTGNYIVSTYREFFPGGVDVVNDIHSWIPNSLTLDTVRPRPNPRRGGGALDPAPPNAPAPHRSEILRAPTNASAQRNSSRKSVVAEIEEIQERMRSDWRGYFADEPLQARYRELIAMREGSGRRKT